MRILLSGKSGQLGHALAERLPKIGDLVAPPRDTFDLEDEASLHRTLDAVRPTLIVNAAAYTAVDKAEEYRETAFAVNATAPKIMANWATANEAAMLHYSTDYVFGGRGSAPIRENEPTNPINAYGATKRAGEIAVAESGAPHLIVRTSWLYNAEGSNFVRTILRLARERDALRIVDDQIGAPTPAWWLADISTEIIRQSRDDDLFVGSHGGLLHAAPAGETSWYGFATAIVDGARERSLALTVEEITPIPSSAYPTPAARPNYSVFNLDRLRRDFRVEPPHWRDSLDPVLDEIAKRDGAS